MQVLSKNNDGSATIRFSKEEMGLLALVGTEFTQGEFAPDDEQWEQLVPRSREEVMELVEALPIT